MELLNIDEAAWKLRNGSVIAYPTETVFGLGAIIYDTEAVLKIKKIKNISSRKPLSVIISKNNQFMLNELVEPFIPVAQRLAKFFWPGPLTILHKAKDSVPESVTGDTGFIGIRCSDLEIVSELVDKTGHPIITTSANPTGKEPAKTYEDVFNYFNDQIDGVLTEEDTSGYEQRSLKPQLPSTIVKVDYHNIEIIREGAISKEDILNKVYK